MRFLKLRFSRGFLEFLCCRLIAVLMFIDNLLKLLQLRFRRCFSLDGLINFSFRRCNILVGVRKVNLQVIDLILQAVHISLGLGLDLARLLSCRARFDCKRCINFADARRISTSCCIKLGLKIFSHCLGVVFHVSFDRLSSVNSLSILLLSQAGLSEGVLGGFVCVRRGLICSGELLPQLCDLCISLRSTGCSCFDLRLSCCRICDSMLQISL